MILCRSHNFIFLKTKKTAGTSVELALRGYCGPGDIVTPLHREDEIYAGSKGIPGPQNFQRPLAECPWRQRLFYNLKKRKPKKFKNHMPAYKIKTELGNDIWEPAFKFAIERNPWDKVVSMYHWALQDPPKNAKPEHLKDLGSYVESGYFKSASGKHIYTINNKICIDKIIFYEDLIKELNLISEQLGLPSQTGDLMRIIKAKSKTRPASASYRDYYTARTKDIVARHFQFEINEFGYEF